MLPFVIVDHRLLEFGKEINAFIQILAEVEEHPPLKGGVIAEKLLFISKGFPPHGKGSRENENALEQLLSVCRIFVFERRFLTKDRAGIENWEVADFRDVSADILHLAVKNERKGGNLRVRKTLANQNGTKSWQYAFAKLQRFHQLAHRFSKAVRCFFVPIKNPSKQCKSYPWLT